MLQRIETRAPNGFEMGEDVEGKDKYGHHKQMEE